MKTPYSISMLVLVCVFIIGAQSKPSHKTSRTPQSRLGTYHCNEGKDDEGAPYAWYIILKADGKFIVGPPSAVEGMSQGTFTVKGDVITFKFPGQRVNGRIYGQGSILGRFKGDAIITQLDTENDDDDAPKYHKYVQAEKKHRR